MSVIPWRSFQLYGRAKKHFEKVEKVGRNLDRSYHHDVPNCIIDNTATKKCHKTTKFLLTSTIAQCHYHLQYETLKSKDCVGRHQIRN